jgi:DNA-binding MarR family transcriptional regulator
MKKAPNDIDELLPHLLMLRRLMHTRFVRASGKFDPYGWVRMETLRFIDANRRPSMQEIAEHLGITAASATSLVATLAKGKLVARSTGKEDKRVVRIELTKAGKRELARAIARGEKVMTEIFSELSLEDIRTLSRVFGRLRDAHGL